MIYTEYDPLQEIIVGDSYLPGDLDKLLPKHSLKGFNKILEETKEDLDALAELFTKFNIKVHRPKVYRYDNNFSMPNFDVNLPMSPLVPRDAYFVRGQTILQTYTSLADRYFDSLSYYHIFKELFDQGYNWISQPLPMLTNLDEDEKWYFDRDIYKNKLSDKLLWHTATMFQAGDAVIVNELGPGSPKGLEWVKRNLPETRFIKSTGTIFDGHGHIDHGFILVDDNTVIHAGIEWVPEVLRNKRLIDIKKFLPELNLDNFMKDYKGIESKYNVKWIDKYLENWKGYNQEVCFDLNVVIVDSKNIIWAREIPDLFEFLMKELRINSWVSPIRHSLFWEGGIHCSTLDLKRDGVSRKII